MVHRVELELAGRTLSIETGKVAKQADAAVWVQYGETIILATAVSSKTFSEGRDFLPLTVDYRERMYAAGRIPGARFRREGPPSEKEILSGRQIDHAIRPLFPKDYFYETQVSILVLSYDQENDADILGLIGGAAALHISDIPFKGPLSATRVGRVDGAFCQLINKLQAHYKRNKYSPDYFWTINRPRNLSAHDNFYKMFTLNLVNYESSLQGLIDRKTVEFRMPEGTLNESDVINWIRLFVTFVDNCKKKLHMPSNTISVSLSETLNILGLSHNKKFYILSKGMFKTKSWLLKRIMQQAAKRKSDRLYKSSFKLLDFMEH